MTYNIQFSFLKKMTNTVDNETQLDSTELIKLTESIESTDLYEPTELLFRWTIFGVDTYNFIWRNYSRDN
jgi:hypothetical protein